jgi:F0F1-type ATP synthase epsilon subunit
MCVLANHIPLLTGLGTEVILIRTTSSSDWIVIFVAGGFALVRFYLFIIKF